MRDRAVQARMFRDLGDAAFVAHLTYPNGVFIEIQAPSFRKLVNVMRGMNLDTSDLFEFQIPDGIGVLERALR